MKGLRVTKVVKEIKFERVLWELRSKKGFPETISHKKFETNASSPVKELTTGKVWFPFFGRFLLESTKFPIFLRNLALGYPSMKFRHFTNIS